MRTRPKALLSVSVALLLLFLYLFLTLSTLLSRNYADFEREILRENVILAQDALSGRRDDLNVKLGDWAQWDDTYEFVADENQDYIDSNLQNEAFDLLNVNLIAITDESGDILFAHGVDQGESTEFPDDLRSLLSSQEYFPGAAGGWAMRSGLLSLSRGELVFASRPITSSDGQAVPNGRIFFGYFLEQGHNDLLSSLTHLNIDVYRYDAAEDTVMNQSIRTGVMNEPVYIPAVGSESDSIFGFSLIRDALTEKPAIILSVEIPRDVYFQGQKSIGLFLRTLVIASVVIVLVVLGLFEFIVLRKLSRLEAAIVAIGRSGDSSARLKIDGTDELGQLGLEINRMLEALDDLGQQQAKSDSQLRLIAELASIMIWMSGPDSRATYFNKGWLDFTGESLEESLGDGWAKYFHPDDIASVRKETERAVAAKQPFQIEYRLRRHDGEYRWILANGKPYFHGKEFQGYIGSGIDITERKQSEDYDRESRQETEKMNQLMVARELRMVELKEEIKKLKSEREGRSTNSSKA